MEKKRGEAVVPWVNVESLSAFSYEQRHAACRGVLWGGLRLGGNSFFFLYFYSSHPIHHIYLPLFFSPFYSCTAWPANKEVPNKNITLTFGSNLRK